MFRKTCLLIEDSKIQARVIMQMLADHGWNVFSALNLEHGLRTVESEHIDLVLCDMDLGDVIDLSVILQIREINNKTQIAAMCADTQDANAYEVLQEAKKMGAEYILQKPFNKATLNEVLSECEERAKAGGRKKHVLLIDENEDCQEAGTQILQKSSYKTTSAHFLEEVMYKLNLLDLDAIVIDIDNDDINPSKAFPFIKETLPGVAIIASTANPNITMRKALNAGAETAITKPFEQKDLLNTVHKAILLSSTNFLQMVQNQASN